MTPRHGFTLLELLLVMALIVVLGAMAFPPIEAMYADARLVAAADQIRARWADARNQAIDEGRAYRFAIQPDGHFRIAPDSGRYWPNGATAPDVADDPDAQEVEIVETLPEGVK